MKALLLTGKLKIIECSARQNGILKGINGGQYVNGVWFFPLQESICKELWEKAGIWHQEIEKQLKAKKISVDLKKYRFKSKPFQHQIEGMIFILNRFGIEAHCD